jgi:hypothetical protein
MERMAEALLKRPDMLAQYGDQLFWSCWTAVQRARVYGVGWDEITKLTHGVSEIAARGPMATRRSRLGKSIRLLGPRLAYRLETLVSGPPKVD